MNGDAEFGVQYSPFHFRFVLNYVLQDVNEEAGHMLALHLEEEVERRVVALARRQGRNKSALVQEALIRYMEDQEHPVGGSRLAKSGRRQNAFA